jgi:polyribonucleotide nucleotidyltransferase
MNKKEYTSTIGGKEIVAQFTDLAEQANGSVILKSANTVVMATAVIGKSGSHNPGWFNLTVEYLEKHYATGQILGSRFQRREGRPTDEAILSARVIDRTIRPLFEHHIKNPVQVIITVLSIGDTDPGILGVNAASMALAVSDIPWNGPIGAVHVGKKKGHDGEPDGETSVDIYFRETESNPDEYALDMTVCGKAGNINMIEAMACETSEDEISEAFHMASHEITKWENWQKEIVAEIGKEKMVIEKPETPESVQAFFEKHCKDNLWETLKKGCSKQAIYDLEDEWRERISEEFHEDEETQGHAHTYYHEQVDAMIHTLALEHDRRADGRDMDTVRPLYAQAGGVSPLLHGSGIFYRGETHVLSVLTLGGPDDGQLEEGMEVQRTKRFMHHYNFPPYSAGETGRVGGMNRRETGHGMLAEKALIPVLPNSETFPYTIRVVSESTASNGSTSQASICASSLALMDGGVPVKRPVAGIAMGAMTDENDNSHYKVLTDIQGPEDHHGDMDFKVAGTREGVTAIQLDIKVDGVSIELLTEALGKAKTARLTILETIEKEIPEARSDISLSAPKILSTKIEPDMIGRVIGKGGETIQKIQEETEAEVTIKDDGMVYLTGKNGAAEKALEAVQAITKEWNEGDTGKGEIIKIIDGIGAIVKLSPYSDGMVHISEIANVRVEKVEDYLAVGMNVPYTVIKVDKAKGRIGLSIKKDNPDFAKVQK